MDSSLVSLTLWRKPTIPFESGRPGGAGVGADDLVLLSTNDYLGLACDRRVITAAVRATERFGAGARAARSLGGDTTIHRALEEELADFKRQPAVVAFSSGFACNYGVLAALMGGGGTILSDALNHASIIDGARASRAAVRVYEHRSMESLRAALEEEHDDPTLVVTDGVFSMEGTTAPLPAIVNATREKNARVVVDDAHATGVFGEGGRGTPSHFGVEESIDIETGTLGKALGSVGGFVAGPEDVIASIADHARTFLFSTSPPAGSVAAALEALRILRSDDSLVERLWSNARQLHAGLRDLGYAVPREATPIMPVALAGDEAAKNISIELRGRGIVVQAVGAPYVSAGTSRLRVIASAGHSRQDLARAIDAFAAVRVTVGYDQSGADSVR